jgi:hypothetical protein
MGIKDLLKNKRKVIILFYTFIFLFFAIPYVIHLIKLASVATSISLRESEQEKRFDKLITDVRKHIQMINSFLKTYIKSEKQQFIVIPQFHFLSTLIP